MSSSPHLFAGTSGYYARYRPPYPDQIFRSVADAFQLDGSGRLLDVGCGPGTFAIPLSRYFSEAVGIDASPDMIREAEMQGRLRDALHVQWRVLPAEEISPDLGTFRLVSIASAFHWMNRDLVLARCSEVLQPGGGLVITGGVSSWWESEVPWHKAVIDVIKAWLGPDRRTTEGLYSVVEYERFEAALDRSDFQVFEHTEIPYTHIWDTDSVIGFLYSTSFANQSLLGARTVGFEDELRQVLDDLSPDGGFQEVITFDYILARKA